MADEETECDPSIVSEDSCEIDDTVCQQLKAVFFARGKGRRPNLPIVPLTDKLLLHILQLKEEGGKTFDEAAFFLNRLFPTSPVWRLRSLLVSAKAKQRLTPPPPSAPAVTLQLHDLGPFLQGIDRVTILEGLPVSQCLNPTFGLLKDLLHLKQKENGTYRDVCKWWCHLTGTSSSEPNFRKAVAKFTKKNAKLQSNASRPAGKEAYDNFLLSSPFQVQPSSPAPSSESACSSDPLLEAGNTIIPDHSLKLADTARQLLASRRKQEELEADVARLELRCAVLLELNKDKQLEMKALQGTNAQLLANVENLKSKVSELERKFLARNERVDEITRRLNYVRDRGVEKKLQRKETKLEELRTHLKQTEDLLQDKADVERGLRDKLRQQQVAKAEIKRQLDNAKQKMEVAAERAAPLEMQDEDEIIRLKNELGHFKKEAKVAIMALMGECEVPAHRCGVVIKTVVQNICAGRVLESDLPSQRTALRFADQMHVLSKAHVAETLQRTDHWDLHVDGTSRGGVKYVCQQITTGEGTLSLGFIPVATEDTSTLVDITIQMLEEISDIYSGEQAQQMFLQMLISLTSVMSDRAAVMKSFARSLQDERRLLLQSDEGLEFLHCNAHYLLGMGTACKNVLATEEKEGGVKLGRDALPRFNSFKATECSAFRYIRTACDVLGPRGDDKNGMRDSWEAYCLTVGRTSAVTSFRENRFNNLFQAAAGLHYHRQDIQECTDLMNHIKTVNGKIQSVAADSRCETIDNHIIALGLLYFRITGPYWSLLGASVHYLDFYSYVGQLHAVLLAWSQDASTALDVNCESLFPDIVFNKDNDILESLLSIGEVKKAAVATLLQKICIGLLEMTKRQLGDFLPEGRYFNVQDPALRAKLEHSHITNLVSEENFADLDFSLFKRRNSTLHHHSTMNMLKRNRSMSTWLAHKSEADQQQLLEMCSKKAASLREKHVALEKEAVRRKKDMLQEARQKKDAADERQRQKVLSVMEDLRIHQGPCTTAADINRMLAAYRTDGGLKKALRAEILFQKLVLAKSSPLLRVSGSSLTLANRLLAFFGEQAMDRLPPLHHPDGNPAAKRPRTQLLEEEEEPEEESEEDEDEEDRQAVAVTVCEHSFKFSRHGEMIAVYYEDTFYIGEVMDITGEEEAVVNFMEQAKDSSVFRWPSKEDHCAIAADVVFAGNLVLAPSSSSSRSFIVESPQNLPELYRAFKAYLIENLL